MVGGRSKKKDFQEYASDLGELMSEDVFKMIERQTGTNKEAAKYIQAMFVSRFVQMVVASALEENKHVSDKELLKVMSETKMALQNAVAAGFQNAMTEFSGRQVEYYCQIKVVPEPVSNKLN